MRQIGRRALALGALFACLCFAGAAASEKGSVGPSSATYVIHHIERPIGEERDDFTRGPDGVTTLASTLDYTDRGGRIQMTSSLRVGEDLTPKHFEARGKSYRFVNVDTEVDVQGTSTRVRNFGDASSLPTPSAFFTARGYAPLAARALLIDYWERHDRPREIALLPDGNSAKISFRGVDSVRAGGRALKLRRFAVDGVVWGREAVWLDDRNQLAALFTRIHILPLEAVRSDLLDALPALQERAVKDRIEDLDAFAAAVTPLAAGSFALVGARVFDGTGAQTRQDTTILVRDGRIAAVGTRSEARIPKGTRVIVSQGKTIIPGLFDMHGHLGQIEWAPAYLAAGVTTARDVGGERRFLTALRDAISRGPGPGPRLLLAGLVDGGGPNGYGTTIATTPAEGLQIVDDYKALRFQQIKLYSQLRPDVVSAVAQHAHELGMTVTGHIPIALSFRKAIESGMDQFEHLAVRGQSNEADLDEVLRFLADRGTVASLTLAWDELLSRDPGTSVSAFEPGIARAPIPLVSSYESVKNNIDREHAEAALRNELALVGRLHRAGVTIVAGTDGALPGYSLLRCLELFVQAGMTPGEAIASATRVPAKFMGLEREVGTIEPGKRADLLVLDADPLEDISNIRKGRWVVSNGRMYETGALWSLADFRTR